MSFTFDLYQTLAISAAALAFGSFIRKKISFFERFCIPAPVIGGLIFAVISWGLYETGAAELAFDETIRDVCMVFFFTCVGFQADLKTLKAGGRSLALFSLAIGILIIAQNTIAVGMSRLLNISPAASMCAGSISLVGGHGTSGAFGPILEVAGLEGASAYCIAAATYGLIAGGLLGGPIGDKLIRGKELQGSKAAGEDRPNAEEEVGNNTHGNSYGPAVLQLITAAGIGTVISWALTKAGLTFPIYVGAMIAATIMRNLSEYSGKFRVSTGEINDLSGIFLNLFLGAAMISLKLWQLAGLALPLLFLLLVQTVFMGLYAYFLVFRMLGHDYDAAVMCGGICGLGLGASPTAMANMQSICRRYGPSVKAFLIVPVVGGVILDLINSIIITLCINLIG